MLPGNVTLSIKLAFKELKEDSLITSKLIGWFTKSRFSHVEIIIDDLWISSTSEAGVHVRKQEFTGKDKWAIVDLGEVTITDKEFRELMYWLYHTDFQQYDWEALFFSQFLPLNRENENRMVCSEIVTLVLQRLKFKQVEHIEPHNTSPGELATIFKVE